MENRFSSTENLPNSMKYIVFKELVKLIYTLKSQNNASYKVALLTAAGTIVGTIAPCSEEKEMIKFTDDPEQFILDTSSIFDVLTKEYYAGKSHPEYSDAYMVNILDADIYRNGLNGSYDHIDQIIIFADQVIGFSLIRK